MLLSIYLRDFADRSEIDTRCFPFYSRAERERLLLAKRPAESGAQCGHGGHQDSKTSVPFTDSRACLGGRKDSTITALLQGAAGDATRLDNGWRQLLLPRVRLSGGAAQIATGAGPSLRKHYQRRHGNSDGGGDAHRCDLGGGDGGGGGAMPAAATFSTFAVKERVGTASAFAILLSELASAEHSDSEAPAQRNIIPAASVSMTADAAEGHEAGQASTAGNGQPQARISSGSVSRPSTRVDCRRSLFTPAITCSTEGSAPLEDTQEGNTSEWREMSAAVLMALDIQAEAFKRQMHGVK